MPRATRCGLRASDLNTTLVVLAAITVYPAVRAAQPGTDRPPLADHGATPYQIILEPDALPATNLAATELQQFVQRSTGARIPIVAPTRRGGASIVLSVDQTLPCDGFRISVSGADIQIVGHDSAGDPRTISYVKPVCCGTLYGVYEFLERVAGVRLYWPDELGFIVPRHETLVLPPGLESATQAPYFWLRRLQYGPGWRPNDEEEATRLWGRRLRLGSARPHYCNHWWQWILNVEEWAAKGHPEYAALVGGKRAPVYQNKPHNFNGFVCTSNPEVIDIFAQYVRNSKEPSITIAPNDGYGTFCECDACRALDNGRTIADGPFAGRRELSDRMITFYNAVAEKSGRPLTGYAYAEFLEVPMRTPLHPLVTITMAINNAYLVGNPMERARAERLYRGWGAYSPRTTVYDIFYLPQEMPDIIASMGEGIEERIRLTADNGMTAGHFYIAPKMELGGADAWVAAKLFWNPRADAESLRRQYYRDLYGAAGNHVRAIYAITEQGWRDAVAAHRAPTKRKWAMQKLLPEMREAFRNAKAASAGDGPVLARLERLGKVLDQMAVP